MKDVWVVSDTHLGHKNILEFEPTRPGNNIDEHDAILLDNWNSVVKPGDKVYHLGDVFMGNKERFAKMWPLFNGKKRLIVGNHDDVKFLSSGSFFEKVMLWRIWRGFPTVLLFTHVPVHTSVVDEGRFKKNGFPFVNIHGHTHSNGSPEGPYKSVCVELINYTPVHIEELV